MTTPHNPENVPQSAVPSGWRFKREGEKIKPGTPCRTWSADLKRFNMEMQCAGNNPLWTYIVPDESSEPAQTEATLRDAVKAAYEAMSTLMPFVLEDYYPASATEPFKSAVESAQETLNLLKPHV